MIRLEHRSPIVIRVLAMVITVAVAVTGAASPAAAQAVQLRYTPADTTIALGDPASLSIWLDEPIDVRRTELWVSYDPTILGSTDGQPGQLYMDTGAIIWEGFEDGPPGQWHGYAIVIGADVWVTGPGELYRWSFTGSGEGVAEVVTVDMRLSNPLTVPYDVSLAPTTVTVANPISDVLVPSRDGPSLGLSPNPFNPVTRLHFQVPGSGRVLLEVFDLGGRKIGTIWNGWSSGGPHDVRWEGRDDAGKALAGGVYLFRLQSEWGVAHTRGILLK